MKKIISIFLAALTVVCCFSATITANAYDAKKCINISISGKAYTTQINEALTDVNSDRAELGLDPVTLDTSLTNTAKKRAAQLVLFVNSNEEIQNGTETLPNGDSVSTLIKGHNQTVFTGYGVFTAATKQNAYSDLKSLADENLAVIQSLGAAFFQYGNIYVYYVIISASASTAPLTAPSNAAYSTTEAVNVKNIKDGYISLSRKSENKGYNLSTKVKTDGMYGNWINVANSQITYASSNSKIVKIKGTKAYTKKSGKVTISAKNKSGTVFVKNPISASATTYKPVLKSLKSSKKSQLTVKWQNTMSNSSGFEIQYSTDKNFKKGNKKVTVKGKKKTSYTIKKLKSKKKYYVRVRAYIDQGEGEKLYSGWSSKKNLKVK